MDVCIDEHEIIERITSKYSLDDTVNILGLEEADIIAYLVREHWHKVGSFTDVFTEMDYDE